MSCNLLGSLWNKFCDSCALGNLCNCSRNTTIIIGQVNPESLEQIRQVFDQAGGDLLTALKNKVELPPVQNRTVTVHTRDDEEQYELPIRIAIMDLAKSCLESIGGANPDEEAISRFIAACELCKIDLKDRFKLPKGLNKKEVDKIQKKAQLIAKFGSQAASLWELAKNSDDADAGRRLNQKQVQFFNFIRQDESVAGELHRSHFGDLSPKVQALFLREARRSPDSLRAQFPHYKSWTGKRVDVEDEKIDDR
ncbi:MAG: hypothetical protein JSS32_10095 [Verrucomicrobia bacterium]|nr:hypothetical protein [Verrucomicrobiota bacterium]